MNVRAVSRNRWREWLNTLTGVYSFVKLFVKDVSTAHVDTLCLDPQSVCIVV